MAAISTTGTAFTTGATAVSGIITAINLGGISTAEIDVTQLSDTSKNYIMGTRDGGTVEVTVMVDTTAGVPDLPTAGSSSPTSFVLRFGASGASGPTFTFSAYVQSVSTEAALDGAVSATYTLRISGSISVA
jgi:hypothetical protein